MFQPLLVFRGNRSPTFCHCGHGTREEHGLLDKETNDTLGERLHFVPQCILSR